MVSAIDIGHHVVANEIDDGDDSITNSNCYSAFVFDRLFTFFFQSFMCFQVPFLIAMENVLRYLFKIFYCFILKGNNHNNEVAFVQA